MHWIYKAAAAIALLIVTAQSTMAVPGDVVTSFSSPQSCPQGLAFDGSYLWNVDRLSDMIYKIDPGSGTVVESIPAPGYVPRGLTWGNGRLWCVDAEDGLIYSIDPQTEIVDKTLYCPVSRPTGLAWDGNCLWICSDRGDEIHQISPEDGTTMKSIPAPTRNSCGLAFDGTYLWVSDRVEDAIYMVAPQNGNVIITLDAPGPHSWGLAWDGSFLWNVDYQTDLIYKLAIDDGVIFSRRGEKVEKVEFIHQVRNYGPDVVKTLDVYLAVPHDRDNQALLGEVEFDPKPKDMLIDKWGQKVAHYQFRDMKASQFTTVKMMASAKLYQTRYFVFPHKVGALENIPAEIRDEYLADDTKFSMSSPVIRNAVKAAIGDETNPYWIARNIYNYVIEHMEYELAGGWNIAPAVLERGNGSCSEYSFVYIAMCRAAGLPAACSRLCSLHRGLSWRCIQWHRWLQLLSLLLRCDRVRLR